MLDESKMLPVNYGASAEGEDLKEMQSSGADLAEQPDVESAQFVEYNVDMCCVVGTETAKRHGGEIRMITSYPLDAQDTESIATQLAERLHLLLARLLLQQVPDYQVAIHCSFHLVRNKQLHVLMVLPRLVKYLHLA